MSIHSKNLQNLNIIVAGRSGVGKSTLINKILKNNRAQTGIGLSITTKIDKYTTENLTFYDTPSLELDSIGKVNLKRDLLNLIKQKSKTNDINQFIHCIWYCVRTESMYFDEMEKKFLALFQNIPIIIVLTRAYDDSTKQKMAKIIHQLKIRVNCIIPIVAEDEILNSFSPPVVVKYYGISDLIYMTANTLKEPFKSKYLENYFNSRILKTINVIIAGKSGVGKSTLINSVLGVELAETGIGKPITQEIKVYKSKKISYNLIDTPGFELDANKQEQLKQQIYTKIKDRLKTKDINQYIHCIWYCIRSDSGRIEETEIEFINSLSNFSKTYKIQIFLILTQCYDADITKKMRNEIQNKKMHIKDIIEIVAKDDILEDYDPPTVIKAFGLNRLTYLTSQIRNLSEF